MGRIPKVVGTGTVVTVTEPPLHRRLADDLRRRIGEGTYTDGWLESERDLQAHYQVSRNTVRLALQTLVSEGLIAASPSRGYAVRHRETLVYDLTGSERADRRAAATHDIWITDVKAQGRNPGMRLEVLRVVPPPEIAGCLELQEGETVVVRRRLRLVDDEPYSLSTAYWPLSIAAGTPIEEPHDMQPGPLAYVAAHGRPQVRVTGRITPRMPTAEETTALNLPAATPVAEHTRTGYDADGVPLRTTVDVLPGHRFVITYELAT